MFLLERAANTRKPERDVIINLLCPVMVISKQMGWCKFTKECASTGLSMSPSILLIQYRLMHNMEHLCCPSGQSHVSSPSRRVSVVWASAYRAATKRGYLWRQSLQGRRQISKGSMKGTWSSGLMTQIWDIRRGRRPCWFFLSCMNKSIYWCSTGDKVSDLWNYKMLKQSLIVLTFVNSA